MNLITRNPENNKLKYNDTVGEIMFYDIIEQIENEKELEIVVNFLCKNLETVVYDWYADHNIKGGFNHCNIEVYFETEN